MDDAVAIHSAVAAFSRTSLLAPPRHAAQAANIATTLISVDVYIWNISEVV
jgi:hypothetical protein